MVEFSSYMGPMDRGYGSSTEEDNSTNDVGIGVQDIGTSVPLGIAAANVQGIAAKIRAGAGSLELGFPGVGRGQRNAQTPGQYGKDQRQAIRELAEINEVDLTTHAAYGAYGMAGVDQQGNFSGEQRKFFVDEIRRAVDFAADTAKGGSVVVHTGEFQRPLSEAEFNKEGKYADKFRAYEEEPERATIRVVDDRTGVVQTQVRKNQEVSRPVWNRAEKDYDIVATRYDEKLGYKPGQKIHVGAGQYVDYEGNPVHRSRRVPKFNDEQKKFEVTTMNWNDFVEEAREINEERSKELGRELTEDEKVMPEEAYIRATLETNAANARGWALNYSQNFEEMKDSLGKLRKAYDFYKKLEDTTDEDEKWRLMREERSMASDLGFPGEYKLTSELIKKRIDNALRSIDQAKEASSAQEAQAKDAEETMRHMVSAGRYALKQSFKSYAEAGLHAYDKTRHEKLEKPLMVTMENIFPESYGGHPDELIDLIEGSRKKMVEQLHNQRGIDKKEAEDIAKTHIKATLDTGHLNMWRKYWQNDPDKSMDENDEDFKKWFLEKVEDLAKKDMVGNVHMVDNYGYQDDHLSPGEGITPVKEAVEILKKHGYKGALTIEPGADASTDQSDFHGLMKTWKLFGSPVYGAHGPVGSSVPQRGRWGDVQNSYFGKVGSPYYVFGPYSPSQDWTLWTQTPME